jgi:hypothetical protein
MALLASSRLVPLWQLLLLGLASFWGGMYVMAVKWAGVPLGQLSLSRVAPMMVLSLELLCTGGSARGISRPVRREFKSAC